MDVSDWTTKKLEIVKSTVDLVGREGFAGYSTTLIARQELETAKTNLIMARAQLQAEKEARLLRAAEEQVILAQLEEKRLYSPFAGVVVTIDKEEGELVGGLTGESILTLVQLDPLLAEFNLPPSEALSLKEENVLPLTIANQTVAARITYIAPLINAESGTVVVRLVVANADLQFVSGTRALLSYPLTQETHPHGSGKAQTAD